MQTFELIHFSEKNLKPWVYGFLILYTLAWTLAPALVRFGLPMDALEGATWGQQLIWGYDKNPFMNAWLTAFGLKISQSSEWILYLFSQLSVAICFWTVWKLGKKIASPIYAFIAILLLAMTQYYNLHAIDFNDNTLELGLWGLVILFFYQALTQNKISDWLFLGLFAGLSMMTKYLAGVLFIPMFLFMLLYPNTRAEFKKPSLYLSVLTFLLIVTPHFIWLYHHQFITLMYAFNRIEPPKANWLNHIIYPAKFLWEQFEVFIPAFFLLIFLCLGKKPQQVAPATSMKSFDKYFLFYMGLGPLIVMLTISLVMGVPLRAGWGQPLLTFSSLLLLITVSPTLTPDRLRRFFWIGIIIMIGTVCGYAIALTRAKAPSSANFPGKHIAAQLAQEWHETYHTPLKYVVGARWLAGNIAFYSQDKPSVFIDADPAISPWIDEKKLRQAGALFVWDPKEQFQMNENFIKNHYPNLGPLKILHFSWKRNLKMKPVEIKVAVLPPEVV